MGKSADTEQWMRNLWIKILIYIFSCFQVSLQKIRQVFGGGFAGMLETYQVESWKFILNSLQTRETFVPGKLRA
jgi:hypothetical protein